MRDIIKGYGKDALEGRQDKKVAEDKSNDEEGLETLAKKEGLNVGELKKAGETGIGQKFNIVGNGKEKIEIKINGKKIKERNVLSIRSNSGGIHNSSYILIGTDDGKIKVIFGSPEKYEYNPTNIEKAELIFVEQPKSK